MTKLFLTLGLLIASYSIQAQAPLRTQHFNLQNGLALQGYDPVAYFTQSKAVKGDKKIVSLFEGVTYYFSSTANRDLFNKNPRAYEPQYGGWCAFAMGSYNGKVAIDPETFKIKDGKLYLFYHSWTNNTLTKWNKEESVLQPKADVNWKNYFK